MRISLVKAFFDLHGWKDISFSYSAFPDINHMEIRLFSYSTESSLQLNYLSHEELGEIISLVENLK